MLWWLWLLGGVSAASSRSTETTSRGSESTSRAPEVSASEDGSDKGGCSGVPCEQLCVPSVGGERYECACYDGHILAADAHSCLVDITPSPISFDGHNYARFAPTDDAYLSTNISLWFRPDSSDDGLLVYGGLFGGDDFLSVSLVGGKVVVRMDCGEGVVEDTLGGNIEERQWHQLSIQRSRCEHTRVVVDDGEIQGDHDNMLYKGISMDDGIFLGGVPSDVDFLESRTLVPHGFRGCVREFSLNGVVLLGDGVNRMSNPDMKHACHGTFNSLQGTTNTPRQNLPISGRVLPPKTSNEAARTTTTTKTVATTTRIPTESDGQDNTSNHSSQFFNGSASVEKSGVEIGEYMQMRMMFRPVAREGVVLSWTADWSLFVFLHEGHLVCSFASNVLKSPLPLGLNVWHQMELWRSGRGLLLKVDNQSWVEWDMVDNPSSGSARLVIGGGYVHIPGVVMGGFHGCIKEVVFGSSDISLDGVGSACVEDACGWAGCPGDCVSSLSEWQCLCSFPSYGRKCEKTLSMADSAMYFEGNSYIDVQNDRYMEYVTGDSLHLSMEIKAETRTERKQWPEYWPRPILLRLLRANWLLSVRCTFLWKLRNGQKRWRSLAVLLYTGIEDEDFMRVSVTGEGKVQVELDLGAGDVVLTHPHPLSLHKWTTIHLTREGRVVRLLVDGVRPVTTTAPAGSEQLNVYGSLFVGGIPSSSLDKNGFRGCIEWIRIGEETINSRHIEKAVNIEPCTVSP